MSANEPKVSVNIPSNIATKQLSLQSCTAGRKFKLYLSSYKKDV